MGIVLNLNEMPKEINDALRNRMIIECGETSAANYLLEILLENKIIQLENLEKEKAELLQVIQNQKNTIEDQRVQLGGRLRKNKHTNVEEIN